MNPINISRRNLLRGIGAGSVLLLPFMQTRRLAAAPGSTGNLLIFFTPNGQYRSKFGATGTSDSYDFKESLWTLDSFKSQVSVVQGLCNKSCTDKASHEDITRTLTCKTGSDMYKGYGVSIDHKIGNFLDSRPLTLAVEPFRADPNWQTKLSWIADGANDPHVSDPKKVFNEVFANVVPSGSTAEVEDVHARDRSVLDFVKSDISLFKTRLSADDKAKLDLHMEAVRQLEKKLTPQSVNGSASCDVEGPKAWTEAPVPSDAIEKLKQQGELMTDLIAMSFACGLRRVATLQWQEASAGANPAQGGENHHKVSHYEAPNSSEQWPKIDAWYADRFRYALEQFEALGILDNSPIVWASEISEQHNQNNYVNVVAGGGAVGIKTGRYIKYDFHGSEGDKGPAARDSRNKSFADLWVTMQKAMGMNDDTFGDPEFNQGALPELYG